jgi:hypothetical protein
VVVGVVVVVGGQVVVVVGGQVVVLFTGGRGVVTL